MIDDKFHSKTMKTVAFSAARRFTAFTAILFGDLNYAVFSVMFVCIFIMFHTGSIFLGSIGMLLILSSFPITGILFGAVFQIHYFQALQIMVIFIILGIAADDIFVVVDAWK